MEERNEIKLKSPLSLRKLLVPEAADVSGLVADSENGPLQPVLSITGVLIVLHV